jgi:hypothetical protein
MSDTNTTPPPENRPPRDISKAIESLLSGCFWVCWDYFWKLFNLDAVGDEMKEHSSSLNKKRAGVLVVLLVVLFIGGYIESHLIKNQVAGLTADLKNANDTITDLRNYNASRPHKESPAELMGLHDQTNVVSETNTFSTTNLITEKITQTNFMVTSFIVGIPVLDFPQMEKIQSMLISSAKVSVKSTNTPITISFSETDTNALPLSRQIAQIFLASGFTNVIFGSFKTNISIMGVTLATNKRDKSGPIVDAYIQLCKFFGQPVIEFGIDTNMPNQAFEFLVATTTNGYNQKPYAPQRSQRKK